ncbi:WD40 repeat domain-containing serine/threonine protein kinase [Streptomyces sp. NBC_01304]|uniref:WD40 repeat domain-containing serine/threonine protein kinase n=1 Tax=Streptomyces sp. NBC_01304 TaxID=2903818 RepID=UPI002E12447F|nr:serine/threonine protein kinase [Streptomyces sp. NBC_01304]
MTDPLRPGDPQRIGPYPLEGRLGAGGMGQVYLGTSPAGRKVAVKVIRPEFADTPQFRERFAREVDAARRVGGFHTAQVVDADPHAESPWLATEFIPGPTLQQVVTEHGRRPEDAVLRLGAGLAEGLAAIHNCGLVHRDLKPGNVILAADGPRIIDFGIAHAPEAGPMTRTGAIIGTYAYMSPEQVRSAPVSPASDVFSLGSVLAFAATGQGPFDASTVPAIIHRVVSEPPRLEGLAEGGPLHDLIGVCLAKDPAQRPSAAEILHRLSVTGPATTPVAAGPLGRRSVLVGGIAAAATAAVAVPAFLLWPDSDPKGKPKAGPGKSPTPARDPAKPVARLSGNTDNIDCLAFSPDGRTLAGGGLEGEVRLWHLASKRLTATLKGHTGSILSLVYSPDGRTLYSGGIDQTLRHWDVDTRAPKGVLAKYSGEFESVNNLSFSPDGKTLAAGVNSGGLKLVDVSTGRSTAPFKKHTGLPNDIAFSPDGKTLATVGERDNRDPVELWSVETGRLIRTFVDDREKRYTSVMFSPDGKSLAATGDDVKVWDLDTGRVTATFTNRDGDGAGAAYRPGKPGTMVVAGSGAVSREPTDPTGKDVCLWDVSAERVVTTLTGTTSKSHPLIGTRALTFSPDGKTLAAVLVRTTKNEGPYYDIQLWKLP